MNMTPPTPNHKLYVKVGKPNVKRWIQPQAKPDPNVWVLAETVQPPAPKQEAPKAPAAKKEATEKSADPLSGIPDVSTKAEEKPKVEPKPKAKRAPRKTTPKTKSAE